MPLVDDEARPQVTRKREILPSIREFIVANLSNPDLSPASIAEAIGISERQVHRAFKGSDTSVSRTIKRQRLDGAAAQLRSLGADRSITDVAFGVGFNELAHFSRAFREQFGQSPSDYRDAWIAGTEKA
ncbi:helix-turn-helix domain-containing protein [Sphingobium lactosutens]|uniref:helix-turn-helix domain-containing protein n=1 Tax=Sphingobium lactosutens TaxID=522773 RepID=UPI00040AE980|nr:helix-turn-helix domain-containing protein [Sphingobium lactosutens]